MLPGTTVAPCHALENFLKSQWYSVSESLQVRNDSKMKWVPMSFEEKEGSPRDYSANTCSYSSHRTHKRAWDSLPNVEQLSDGFQLYFLYILQTTSLHFRIYQSSVCLEILMWIRFVYHKSIVYDEIEDVVIDSKRMVLSRRLHIAGEMQKYGQSWGTISIGKNRRNSKVVTHKI